MDFTLIVCLNYNNAIGYKETNDLIFHIPQELIHFKQVTTKSRENMMNVLIMGRNTWESIKRKPLPLRMNFIISSNYEDINYEYRDHHNVIAFPDNQTCLSYIDDNKMIFDKTFIIGGKSIYEYYLNQNIVTNIICTKILNENYEGDIFFDPKYFLFFRLKNCESFNKILSYKTSTNEMLYLNYCIGHYSKISRINSELIMNHSFNFNFSDSEEIDAEDEEVDEEDNIDNRENHNEMDDTDSLEKLDIDNLSVEGTNITNTIDKLNECSFYISDSEVDTENENNSLYISQTSLENIDETENKERLNHKLYNDNENNNENDNKNDNENENIKKLDTIHDININDWTLINKDDFYTMIHNNKYKMEYKMQYLKYYYSIHNKTLNNELDLYNNVKSENSNDNNDNNNDNKSYYF